MFSFGLLGEALFGYKLDQCSVGRQVCPAGLTLTQCPDHLNCYVDCSADDFGTWIDVDGSPYNNQAYCEAFGNNITSTVINNTLTYTFGSNTQFIAQVGLPTTANPNYDTLYNAFLAMFVILTQDNYDLNMKLIMLLVNPWMGSLFYILTMIIGVLVVLNLFIAIILSGLSEMEELNYEVSSRKPFLTSVREFFSGLLFWRRGEKVAPGTDEQSDADADGRGPKHEQADIVGHVTIEDGMKGSRSQEASAHGVSNGQRSLSGMDDELRNLATSRMEAAQGRVAAGLPPLPELEGRSLFIFSSKGWVGQSSS